MIGIYNGTIEQLRAERQAKEDRTKARIESMFVLAEIVRRAKSSLYSGAEIKEHILAELPRIEAMLKDANR